MTAPGGDTSDTAPVILDRLGPAAEDGWRVLFDLAEIDRENWVLIGGQMVYLLAIENGVEPARSTDDVDVAVDVRAKPDATEWLASWLMGKAFELESISAGLLANLGIVGSLRRHTASVPGDGWTHR